jgi:hypothetical protein
MRVLLLTSGDDGVEARLMLRGPDIRWSLGAVQFAVVAGVLAAMIVMIGQWAGFVTADD